MNSRTRSALALVLVGLSSLAAAAPAGAQSENEPRFQVIAFDAFPIFDPRPIAKLAEELYPGRGSELMASWRVRQFEYQWLRALSGQYADFLQATEEGLVFAARQLGLELSDEHRQRLMAAYSSLSAWPDAAASVKALREAGVRLVFLSNMTESMLRAGLEKAGLEGEFEAIFSTDQVRSYKPDPKAYRIAVERLGVEREEILFVAFAGWDVAGAEWFGYPTFWVNRLGSPMEELGVTPDAVGDDLGDLVDYVLPGRLEAPRGAN